MATVQSRGSRRKDPVEEEELEMRWESYLNGKRDDIKNRLLLNKAVDPPAHELNDESVIPTPPKMEERDENEPSGIRYPAKEEREDSTVDIFRAFEMFQLIEKGMWKELANHVKKNPQSSFVRMTLSSKGYSLTSKGNLLLHEVCRFEPSLELVDAIISVNAAALKAVGEHGRMPLHFACACGASEEVVQRLVNGFPDATKLRDGADLMLPLHVACKWGASKEVVNAVLGVHPEGRYTRDIFGKTPMDYAKQLGLREHRDAIIDCLQTLPKKVTFNDRSISVKENMVVSSVQSPIVVLSPTAQAPIVQEVKKMPVLSEKRDSRNVQQPQESGMKSLEADYKTLRTLQTGNKQTKALLEKKLEVLIKANEVKQQLIERLEHENTVKYGQDLNNALSKQEQEFVYMLDVEKKRVAALEHRAKEIEITHRMYTEAILEEHDLEAAEFERFTLQFRDLESQLRGRLVDAEERNDFLETEVIEKTKKFKELISAEREKVSFLEEHVNKVNELLETEQKRFHELEAMLRQTIDSEDDHDDYMEGGYMTKEEHYRQRIREEQTKVVMLQRDYEEVRELLGQELERFSNFNEREEELMNLIEEQQHKLREMENNEQLLESERQRSQTLQQSEIQALEDLALEKGKVQELETQLRAVQNELEVERAAVAKLRELLEKKQAEYEAEKSKVKALRAAQANKRHVLESLQQKVSILEEALADAKSIADQENERLEQAWCELEEVKWALEKEKEQVEELSLSKRLLEDILQSEKEKVRNLEQAQVVAEAELQSSGDLASREINLEQNQKLLNMERARVANLKVEQSQLDSVLQSKTNKLVYLESRLTEKEEQLKSDRAQFEALEKQLLETEDILQSEQKRAGNLEKERREIQVRLSAEEKQVKRLEMQLVEARTHIESVEVKMTTLGGVGPEMLSSFDSAEKEKFKELQKLLENYKVQLEAEQELVQELEMELSEAHQVCDDEKRRIAELKEQYEKASSEVVAEKKRVDALEQDKAKTNVLLESEQIKVKALEHARDQLQALLEWEKKNLKTNLQKHKDAVSKLSATEKQLAETAAAYYENKTVTVDFLSQQLEVLGDLRKEVIRLNSEGRHKDFLLANILKAVGTNARLRGHTDVKNAQDHSDMLAKIIGFDLSKLEETAILEQGALVRSAPRDVSNYRRLKRTLFWTIPLIPLIAISQDPSIIEGITSQLDPQMLQELTANIAALASNLDPSAMREMAHSLSANIAKNIDPTVIRETIPQMFGIATSTASTVAQEVVKGVVIGSSAVERGAWMQV